MSMFDTYVLKNFLHEMTNLGYDQSLLETYSIWKFRYICYKLNIFLKNIPLPKIKRESFYEAVFIDFRILPNIEFIIRNCILKLGSKWSYTIVCGLNNYSYIENIVNTIDKNINIIKLEYDNLTNNEYSNLLMTEAFWKSLYGEKILIYQEDSLIFHNNITPFLKYDYIGAPFPKNNNDTQNGVGNGGLSLRTKCKMLEVIKKCCPKEISVSSFTKAYMELNGLENPPEDVYFSKTLQKYKIGDVADWNTASLFSSEQIFNKNSFGGHKFWMGNDNWQSFLKELFVYEKYKSKSGLNKYLKFKGLDLSYNNKKKIENAFDIDLEFFCYTNNMKYVNDKTSLEYISKIGLDGFVYHPKQLFNIFGKKLELYKFMNNIYTFYKNNIYTLQSFVNTYIYNSTFEYIADMLIKKKYGTLNDNYDTLVLVFLGNETLSINLLKRLINYKTINKEFNIAFCININAIKDVTIIKKIIKENFDFYSIYYSKEFGTDITPTMLMYNDIIKNHKMKHILKFHTKTISDLYNKLTDYLLTNNLSDIINSKKEYCNCIGPNDTYINMKMDKFNNSLKNKYIEYINLNNSFVEGTIFYTTNNVFNKVLEFIKNNNYRSYILNNLYENNSINQDFSPIHFLERLFGSIRL